MKLAFLGCGVLSSLLIVVFSEIEPALKLLGAAAVCCCLAPLVVLGAVFFIFLAQDLEHVLPHLVTEDDEGYKGVAYERLGVYAVAGVKALDESMEQLRNDTVARLEARVVELERALAARVSRASGPTPAER